MFQGTRRLLERQSKGSSPGKRKSESQSSHTPSESHISAVIKELREIADDGDEAKHRKAQRMSRGADAIAPIHLGNE